MTAHVRSLSGNPPLVRYDVQADVLLQLGDKLETNLQAQEMQLEQMPREQAAKRRATLVKLNRDFRKIEAVYKNLVLDARRKRAYQAQHKQPIAHNVPMSDMSQEEQRIQLELQLQQDVSSCWTGGRCRSVALVELKRADPPSLHATETE